MGLENALAIFFHIFVMKVLQKSFDRLTIYFLFFQAIWNVPETFSGFHF